MNDKYALIGLGRSLRSEFSVPPSAKVAFAIKPVEAETAVFLEGERETLTRFLQASELTIDQGFMPVKPLPSQVSSGATIYLFPASALDMKVEAGRIGKQLKDLLKYVATLEGKLANEKFTRNAPEEVVEKERAKLTEAREKIEKLDQMLSFLVAED